MVTDGAHPDGLVQGTDGNYYGLTYEGGANGSGVALSLSLGQGPFVKTVPVAGIVGTPVSILGTNLAGATAVSLGGIAATFSVISAAEIQITVPSGASTGAVQVTTPSGVLNSSVPFQVLGSQALPVARVFPSSLTFTGQVVSTTSAAQSVTLSNTGTGVLPISFITTNGNFWQTNNCGTSLAAGDSCAIAVTFKPLGAGTYSGTLSIWDNAPGSPQTVALSGTAMVFTAGPNPPIVEPPPTTPQPAQPVNPPAASGGATSAPKGTPGRQVLPAHSALLPIAPVSITVAPAVRFSSSALTFPVQIVGTTSSAQVVTLTNPTDAPMPIFSITVSGDFMQTNDCGPKLDSGGRCTISVTFKPQGAGAATGKLTIREEAISEGMPSTDTGGRAHAITLSGKGQASAEGERNLPPQ